jgi:phosphoribosylglycinamide formyltransferase-1
MTNQKRKPAIAVLCSGAGSNLQAIMDSIKSGKLRARISVVISDKKEAFALERARKALIPVRVVLPSDFNSRQDFDRKLIDIIECYGAELICLAGFMRVLSSVFVRRFKGRILNIHPALLPSFPGAHGVRDALEWGVKVTGVTVHIVDEEVDHGPIVLQEPVHIKEGESEKKLLGRIHKVEHRLYQEAIQLMIEKRIRIKGRKTLIT